MSINLNYVYGSYQIFFVIFDQIKNILLEANYAHLGPETTFYYWLLEFCIEDFCKLSKTTNYISTIHFTFSDEICI